MQKLTQSKTFGCSHAYNFSKILEKQQTYEIGLLFAWSSLFNPGFNYFVSSSMQQRLLLSEYIAEVSML
jgi:hypothetical protein